MAAESDWLANLEEQVRAAVERIEALRREREGLVRRVQELEAKLGPAARRPNPAWPRERAEVRRRVERLTARLEELAASFESQQGGGAASEPPASADAAEQSAVRSGDE